MPSAPSAGADTVSLSNVSLQIAQQSGFDQGKVSSIKQAIQNGDYAIDPRRIAQGFTSLEKIIKE
jgi:flagellar biosynthesis anti-sigma factor FlgM